MEHFLSYVLSGFAVISIYISIQEAFRKTAEKRAKYLFIIYQMGSAVWSMFFGLLLAQTNPVMAANMRIPGMIGTFSYLISATLLMSHWARLEGILKYYIEGFAYLGIPLYPFTVSREHISYELSRFGMSYQFAPGFWSYAYSAYSVIIGINMMVMIFFMIYKSPKKRERVMGNRLFVCEIVIIIGMVLDTILPQFGFRAFPGSTITQFLGAVMIYQVYLLYYQSQITLDNMSQFLYYSVNEPILIYDEKEHLCIVSSSAADFLGDSVQEDTDRKLCQIFDVPADILNMKNQRMVAEARCLCNETFCRLGIDRITDNYGEALGYIIVVDDMTDKIRHMRALREARQRADEANEAKSRFLANMSHEIRTPINAILGMDEMILREDLSEEVLEYAMDIKNAGKTLLAIINDILDLSKIESNMMEIVEGEYMVQDMLTELAGEAALSAEKKGLCFTTEFDPSLPSRLYGDEVRLRQIFLNILTNAVKYTKTGKVIFHASFTESTEKEKILLEVFVKDTGIGIEEEKIPRLFDSFQRLDEKSVHAIEGTGLGLSIVKKLVELMKGTLEVKSVYGVGSVFYLHIPQTVVSEEPIGNVDEKMKQRQWKKYEAAFEAQDAKLLVVDDYALNLQVVQGLLKKTKINLTTAESGKECLQKVQEEKFDIIFLDHMMPELDGIETLHMMREMENNLNKDTPVIALTANAITGAKEMYLNEGFADYLSKPINSELLEAMIKEYLPKELIKERST